MIAWHEPNAASAYSAGFAGQSPIKSGQPNLGVKLDKVEISIDGDIDLRGFLGIDDRIRAGFNAVRIRVNLNGPEPAARYEELAATVDAHCPGPRQTSGEPRRNFAVRNSSTRSPRYPKNDCDPPGRGLSRRPDPR